MASDGIGESSSFFHITVSAGGHAKRSACFWRSSTWRFNSLFMHFFILPVVLNDDLFSLVFSLYHLCRLESLLSFITWQRDCFKRGGEDRVYLRTVLLQPFIFFSWVFPVLLNFPQELLKKKNPSSPLPKDLLKLVHMFLNGILKTRYSNPTDIFEWNRRIL